MVDKKSEAMAASTLALLSEHAVHGGVQRFYQHQSVEIGLPMRFSVFLPDVALTAAGSADGEAAEDAAAKASVELGSGAGEEAGKRALIPGLFYLAGLTCTEETFPTKAAAQQHAAAHGLALICPDTSPRGANVEGESDAWDFGIGAGFYLDATQAPWSTHYRMYSYIVKELTALVCDALPVDHTRLGIFGHSMGGHGALVLGLREPELFKSISAFAPIAAPSHCAWGQKAFSGYLGEDRAAWSAYDASALMAARQQPLAHAILIDQGLGDKFLADQQLQPERFEAACAAIGQPLTLRRHARYDHGYYFISSFMSDHIAHHAAILKG